MYSRNYQFQCQFGYLHVKIVLMISLLVERLSQARKGSKCDLAFSGSVILLDRNELACFLSAEYFKFINKTPTEETWPSHDNVIIVYLFADT